MSRKLILEIDLEHASLAGDKQCREICTCLRNLADQIEAAEFDRIEAGAFQAIDGDGNKLGELRF